MASADDLYQRGLDQAGRRLGLKVRKAHATLDMRDLDGTWPTWQRAQATLAAQEYDVTNREAVLYFITMLREAGQPLHKVPQVAPFDQDHITALLRLTGPIFIKRLVRGGWDEQAALLASLRRTVLWLIGDMYVQAQQNVIDLSVEENQAAGEVVVQGYERIAEPDACPFCLRLAGASRKYPVFNRTVKWTSPHPHCRCRLRALPVYRTQRPLSARELALNQAMYEQIKASKNKALAAARQAA